MKKTNDEQGHNHDLPQRTTATYYSITVAPDGTKWPGVKVEWYPAETRKRCNNCNSYDLSPKYKYCPMCGLMFAEE